jgi:uncharacterized tellurite resistance protein B-like protein
MDIFIRPEIVELISRLAGRSIQPSDLPPLTRFLAALVVVLQGVIVIDKTIEVSEERRLQQTLDRFSSPDSPLRDLIQTLLVEAQAQQIYLQPQALKTLTEDLSEAEKLLILGFGCELSAVDGVVDPREKLYLHSMAQRLGINPHYLSILEAGFAYQTVPDLKTLKQIHVLLNPAHFRNIDLRLEQVAREILAAIPLPV